MKRSIAIVTTIFFWLLVAALLAASLTPRSTLNELMPSSSTRIDYFLHFITFIPLPILAYFSSRRAKQRLVWWSLIVFTAIFTVGSELLQLLSNGRRFNPYDMLSNALGLVAGLVLVVLINWLLKRKK